MSDMTDSEAAGYVVGFALLSIPIAIVSAICSVIFRGWLVTKAWGYFVVPFFPGTPSLGVAVAVGLLTLLACARGYRPDPSEKKATLALAWRGMLAHWLFSLLMWAQIVVVHHYV